MDSVKLEKIIDSYLKQRKTYLMDLIKQIGDPNYDRKGSTFTYKHVLSQRELKLLADIYSTSISQFCPSGDGENYVLKFF